MKFLRVVLNEDLVLNEAFSDATEKNIIEWVETELSRNFKSGTYKVTHNNNPVPGASGDAVSFIIDFNDDIKETVKGTDLKKFMDAFLDTPILRTSAKITAGLDNTYTVSILETDGESKLFKLNVLSTVLTLFKNIAEDPSLISFDEKKMMITVSPLKVTLDLLNLTLLKEYGEDCKAIWMLDKNGKIIIKINNIQAVLNDVSKNVATVGRGIKRGVNNFLSKFK